ncbi:fatty acyl-CoA hydrolase precursor, medium chain-like [Mytilus edulis]|uniref:fatty acyl-CoA hydrolase precursor, medium chain-like n=1 Tax=Mytilus edulis TaxID=6550 RepID=UPI0039EE71DA
MFTFTTTIYMALIGLAFTAGDKIETARVNSPSGPIDGLKTQNKHTGMNLHEFRGIPFGKPPVGPLRFKKPEPVDKWTDVLDATEFGAGCPQTVSEYTPDFAPRKMSEDCLFLNVYVPGSLDENRKLSVMVWIYGGGFMAGFSSQYDGGWIATQGNVIVITINYRVDILGFLTLDHPAALGNYGLWDQKLALQWVHDNIESFGGNPDSVTLFGESAGGWSVSFQSLIPSNQGLFHRIIAQSGVVNRLSIMTKKQINDRTIELAQKTSCPINDMFKFVNCLRDKDYSELLEATNMESSMSQDRIDSYQTPYFAVVDGELFHDHPITSLDDKSTEVAKFFKSLDLITGYTSNEGLVLYFIIFPKMQEIFEFNVTEGIPARFICEGMIAPFVELFYKNDTDVKQKMCSYYTTESSKDEQSMRANHLLGDIIFNHPAMEMLSYHTRLGGKSYQYVFSKEKHIEWGFAPLPEWATGSGHGEDLQFMFDMHTVMPSLNETKFTPEEKDLSDKIIQYWTSFAKTGEPYGGEGAIPWKPFDLTSRYYLDLDTPLALRSNLSPKMVEFWSKEIPAIGLERVEKVKRHDEL